MGGISILAFDAGHGRGAGDLTLRLRIDRLPFNPHLGAVHDAHRPAAHEGDGGPELAYRFERFSSKRRPPDPGGDFMAEPASILSSWENFYLIVGPSAAALIGLQFIVMTLIADMKPELVAMESISAFGTPTVFHLGGAVVISVIVSAPWPSLHAASIPLAICGFIGVGYGALVTVRAHRQTNYQPVGEDWIWYITLPFLSYSAITVAALLLAAHPQVPLFVIGGAVLALLLVGVHNTWDTVIYIVLQNARRRDSSRTPKAAPDKTENPS
jgi:hypothetical protein